jgi:acyl carrier protein
LKRDTAKEWQKARPRARQGAHYAAFAPYSLANGAHVLAKVRNNNYWKQYMANREDIMAKVSGLIGPFNNKGVALSADTTFQGDLEWDSLTVMDFVAAVEDEFDIIITMNMQAEIESVGQLADAVAKLMEN